MAYPGQSVGGPKVTAGNFAAAKPSIKNGSYSGGTNLPGAFGQHYAAPKVTAPNSKPGGSRGSNNNTGGTVRTSGGTTTYVDPYARWGGQDAFNQLMDNFHRQKDSVYSTAHDAANNFGLGYRDSILDFISGLRTGQQGIDSKAARNELAKMQGTQGVLGMVGRGVKSSGVMLANKNAGNSSAAGALAGAYGDIGRRELGNVGNQYEMGNEDVRLAQGQLDQQRESGARKLSTSKTQTINQIVSEARDKFAALDAAMADKSLPERIAIDQEKETVRQQVLADLQAYDQQLQEGLGGIHASSADDRRAEASRLSSAGTDLGKDAFSYTTETPAELQGTGPVASELPLFSLQRKKIA